MTTTINANATPTFGIFVQGNGNVPFDPAAEPDLCALQRQRRSDPRLYQRCGADAVTTRANFLVAILIASIKRTHRLEAPEVAE